VAERSETGRTDTASRVILASPKVLFRAFVDREMLCSWRAPQGMTARITRFNPVLGGGYRILLTRAEEASGQGKSSPGEDMADVVFVELDPERRVVEAVTFVSRDAAVAGPMTFTTRFETVVDGTKVLFTITGVPAGIRLEDHQADMASALRRLALLTE
jgi:uncharacterized protein YndB with AHSA1/START domain